MTSDAQKALEELWAEFSYKDKRHTRKPDAIDTDNYNKIRAALTDNKALKDKIEYLEGGLHRAIEAAREYVDIIDKQANWNTLHALENIKDTCRRFKATLPDQPMTEEEALYLIYDATSMECNIDDCKRIIRALREARCLYMREGGK